MRIQSKSYIDHVDEHHHRYRRCHKHHHHVLTTRDAIAVVGVGVVVQFIIGMPSSKVMPSSLSSSTSARVGQTSDASIDVITTIIRLALVKRTVIAAALSLSRRRHQARVWLNSDAIKVVAIITIVFIITRCSQCDGIVGIIIIIVRCSTTMPSSSSSSSLSSESSSPPSPSS